MAFVFRPVVIRRRAGRKVRRRSRFYWACYRDPTDGQEKREPLKFPSGVGVTSREAAEAELRRLLDLRQRLAAGLTNQYIESAGMPVRKLLADYLYHLRRKRLKGRPLSRSYLKQALGVGKWLIGRDVLRLADLSAERIDRALAMLTGLGKAAKTWNIYRAHLHALCEYGVQIAKALERNPVAQIAPHGENPVKVRRALTPDEACRLLGKAGPRALWYEVALYTGLRVGEIAALRWSDLDLDSLTPCVRLRAVTTKAGRADTVPLKRSLADKLRAVRPPLPAADARVFLTTPTRKTFLADCRRAGIETRDDRGRTLDRHALRTTFCSWLSMVGVAPRTAQKLARHTSIELTMRNYTDDRLLDGVGAIENLPDLDVPLAAECETLQATGTDGEGVVLGVVPDVVLTGRDASGHETTDTRGGESTAAVSRASVSSCRNAAASDAIGATGFEPATSWTQTTRSPSLSYAPAVAPLS